jgi:PTS system fructose-specific IIA component
MIFLFAVGNDNENAMTHLKLLAEVARNLGNDESVQALLAASTVNELRAVF